MSASEAALVSVGDTGTSNEPSKQEPANEQQQPPAPPQQQQPTVVTPECRIIMAKPRTTVIRMGPPATLRNWKFHKPLLAVGNQRGSVQIYNLATGKLFRELSIHSYSVRGIEWVGLNAFISYAVSDSYQHGIDSNWELHVTELDTGRSVQLKSGKTSESSVIQSVKVSHLKQYFIVVYRSNPFEIWDLSNLCLLRRVPKKFSSIVAAEWSPLYSKKEPTTGDTAANPAPLRENFVVTNKSGELFHFSIAGNLVKEISKIPPERNMSHTVTAIAWKSDHVVLGREDGNLSVWDLEKRESRILSTARGCIRKIRFAPGRGNMKIMILFEDGVDVWDVRKLKLHKSVFSLARTQPSEVDDADWAASDRPVIMNSSGTIVVTDLEFRNYLEGSKDLRQYRLNEARGAVGSSQSNSELCYLQ